MAIITNGGAFTMAAGTNSTELFSVTNDVNLNNRSSFVPVPSWTNPTSLTIGGNIVLTNGGKFYLRGGVTNGVSPLYGGLLDF